MDLFSRRVLMTGSPAEYTSWAIDMCEYVNGKIENPVSLWAAGFGAPVGTMVYSTWVDGLAGVQANFAALAEDAEYMQKVSAAQSMVGAPSEDSLGQVIHGEPAGDRAGVGSAAVITSAVIANGAYAAAIGWGVEMAQLGEKITGLPSLFMMNRYGTFGEVLWVFVAPDAASLQSSGDAVNADADYMAKLEDVGNLFVPGSGHRTMASRIA